VKEPRGLFAVYAVHFIVLFEPSSNKPEVSLDLVESRRIREVCGIGDLWIERRDIINLSLARSFDRHFDRCLERIFEDDMVSSGGNAAIYKWCKDP